MLSDGTVTATVAVRDIEAAKAFYGDTLGLKVVDETPGGVTYAAKDSHLFVYPSQYAGTNQATAASWAVADIESEVADLKGKGVVFEQYDMPGLTRNGEIHSMGTEKAAWFKDPDGNTISIIGM